VESISLTFMGINDDLPSRERERVNSSKPKTNFSLTYETENVETNRWQFIEMTRGNEEKSSFSLCQRRRQNEAKTIKLPSPEQTCTSALHGKKTEAQMSSRKESCCSFKYLILNNKDIH
jgi:hypothetical protein